METNLKEYFKDDPILITGASGFVGYNLYKFLKEAGLNVLGTCNDNLIYDLIRCDITNYEDLKQVFDVYSPKYVFMTAAKSYGASIMKSSPELLVRENILMNTNTLEVAYKFKVKKLMFFSSSTVYQESFNSLAETDLDLNIDPYPLYLGVGGVKRYTEQLCKFYNSLGLSINIVRPTNIYGPYDKYENDKSHFIPAIIRRALERQFPLTIWGAGNAIKNMTYVSDFIRDLLIVFTNCEKFETFNICSDEYCSIKEIVDIICMSIGCNVLPIYDITKPEAIPYRSLTKNKFNSYFGKQRYVSLEKGIAHTVKWLNKELMNE